MAENPVTLRRQRLRSRAAQHGFTMIELLVALTVMLIGLSGVLSLQMVSSQASSYSRHAGEAAVLGEAKMEEMRTTTDVANLLSGSDVVDAQGTPTANGIFTRAWTVTWSSSIATVTLVVSWLEQGSETHSITYRTQRSQ